LPVFASTFLEYRRYSPDLSFRIMVLPPACITASFVP
jgi:hypothetical protein